jgi:Cu/Zn superoxide dismutase
LPQARTSSPKRFVPDSRHARNAAWATLAIVCALAGCRTAPPSLSTAELDAQRGRSAGLVANLRGLGSAVSGKVRVLDRGDGVTVLVSAVNLPPGGYSIAFHENGNCSSPNGYSAGPIMWPKGNSEARSIPMFTNSLEGNSESESHVSGVHTTGENGLAGRSVIIYGGLVADAQPGVPNNRYACGVFEPTQLLF